MIPTTAAKPHSWSSNRKRKLQDIRTSPESVSSDDILLRGESDDDSDGTRTWKKSRREAFARHYLDHGWVPIMTAKLKGPFENGWKNPWAKRRTKYVKEDLAEYEEGSPSPSVRRVSNKIVKPRVIVPISKGSLMQRPSARSSRTDLQYSTSSKLNSDTSGYQSRILGSGKPQHRQSPTLLPAAAHPDSPSYQLQQQLHEATSQELARSFPMSSSRPEDDPQIEPITSRTPNSHRLPNRPFGHQHIEPPDINGSIGSGQIDRPCLSTDSAVTRTKILNQKLRLSEDRSEEAPTPGLNLEDDLNLMWYNAKVFDRRRFPVLMEWRYTETGADTSKGSTSQQQATRKRLIFYGEKPVVLEDGRVNDFNSKDLKDIRTKLSDGLAEVQRDFDAIKASGNTSSIIACCEITLQLAQTLEKVDHVRQVFDSAGDFPRRSKSGLNAHDAPAKHQDHSFPPDGFESSDLADSDGPLIEQYKKGEKNGGEKRIGLIRDAPQALTKYTHLEQAMTAADPDFQNIDDVNINRDADMGDPNDSERTDVSFKDIARTKQTVLHKADISNEMEPVMRKNIRPRAADLDSKEEPTTQASKKGKINMPSSIPDNNVRGNRPNELLLGDAGHDANAVVDASANNDNSLTTDLDAKNRDADKFVNIDRSFDPDRPIMAGTTFVEKPKNPVIKSLNNEVSSIDKIPFTHDGSTQMNTPDSPELFVSSSQQLQVPSSPDTQNQQQSLVKSSSSFEYIKQTQDHLPLDADLDRFRILQAAAEAEYKAESNHAPLPTQRKHHEQDSVMHSEQPIVTENDGSANNLHFTDAEPKKTSISQTVTVIDLDSESDVSENDAQHRPALKSIKSRNNETLDSIHEVEASNGTRTTNSNIATDELDAAQAAQANTTADSQSRIEKFTSYLQNVHHKVWNKTTQLNQQQPKIHLQTNSHTKPPSTAETNTVQSQGSNRNGLPNPSTYPKLASNSLNANVHPAAHSNSTGTHFRKTAVKLPSLASISTMENEQILSQGANIIKPPSDPGLALKSGISFYSPAITTAIGASAIQQSTNVYKFKPWHPASQPVTRHEVHKFVGYRAPTLKTHLDPTDKPESLANTTSASARSDEALQTIAQISTEDAQRRTAHITESEERDALDAASSLLGIWDIKKEASAIR